MASYPRTRTVRTLNQIQYFYCLKTVNMSHTNKSFSLAETKETVHLDMKNNKVVMHNVKVQCCQNVCTREIINNIHPTTHYSPSGFH
jgi:hypothetical protein